LALLAAERGETTAAKDGYARCLAILEKAAPDSLDVALNLELLGQALMRDDPEKGRPLFERARKIYERRAPGSQDQARNLVNLGDLALRRGQSQEALEAFQKAADIAESQRRQITSPETRLLFSERQGAQYTGLLRAQIALDRVPDAFSTLERARA